MTQGYISRDWRSYLVYFISLIDSETEKCVFQQHRFLSFVISVEYDTPQI